MAKYDRMNVATALNSKYMRYTYVMLTSLFFNHPLEDIQVYLLHNDLTPSDCEHLTALGTAYGNTIHFLKIDRNIFPDDLPTTAAWSLETYFRLMLPDILPAEVDRLLYLDVDMIIDKSLTALYHTDFGGANFCACKDMTVDFPTGDSRDQIFQEHIANGFTYFNAGMMLWNVKNLRGEYSFKRYMELAKELDYRMLAPDQDLLNYMHVNQIQFVDEYKYDLFSRMAYNAGIHYPDVKQETAIIHYAGMKPWEGAYIHYDIEQLWWEYAKMTPFYHELLEEFVTECIRSPLIYDTMNTLSKEKQALSAELSKNTALCKRLLAMLEK